MRTIAVLMLAASLFGGTAAFAQGAAEDRKAPPADKAGQIAGGSEMVNRGEGLSRRVSNMLSEARRESDIIRITCLSDKLTQVNALLGNARQRLEVLRNSADEGQRRHEFTVLTVLGQKFQVLDQEAAQCVGQTMFETGTTRVQTDIDPDSVPFEDVEADQPPQLNTPMPTPGGVDQTVVLTPPISRTG